MRSECKHDPVSRYDLFLSLVTDRRLHLYSRRFAGILQEHPTHGCRIVGK